MKKTKTINLSAIGLLIVAFVLSVFVNAFGGVSVKAEGESDVDFLKHSIDYQGENGWYNYTGSIENKKLVNMFYSATSNYWQGENAGTRTWNDRLLQTSVGVDNVRTYLVSVNGKINVKGSIGAFVDGTVAAEVGIVLYKNYSLENGTVLLDKTTINPSDADMDLSAVTSLQNIEVKVGDGIFFIVYGAENATEMSAAAFKIDIEITEGTEGVNIQTFPSTSIEIGKGDFALHFSGEALRNAQGDLIVSSMIQPTNDGRQQYVVYFDNQIEGIPMDFYPDMEGFPYRYGDITVTGMMTVWGNAFYSNNFVAGTGRSGVSYTVPEDGYLSVIGGYGTINTSTSAKYYQVVKISNYIPEVISSNPVTTTIQYFNNDPLLQDMSVKAGDIVLVLYKADAWISSSMSVIFDYRAVAYEKADDNEEEITTGIYHKKQGDQGWFYVYGDVDRYMMMTYGFGEVDYDRWNGVEWNVAVEESGFQLGAYLGSMAKYVIDRSGTIELKLTARQAAMNGKNGTIAKVYLNNEVLWEKTYAFDDLSVDVIDIPATEVKKGDVITLYAVVNNECQRYVYDSKFSFSLTSLNVESDNSDYVEGEDLSKYLAPITYGEYYNIGLNAPKDDDSVVSETPKKGCGSAVNGEISLSLLGSAALFTICLLKTRRERI